MSPLPGDHRPNAAFGALVGQDFGHGLFKAQADVVRALQVHRLCDLIEVQQRQRL